MNKKWLPWILIIVMAIVIILVKQFGKTKGTDPKPSRTDSSGRKDPSAEVNRNHGFDRRTSYIEYTEHAKCRMPCRHISQVEVEDIMRLGTINYRKSNVNGKPCPTYALEGTTQDGQQVRIVFAQCDYKSKVVTVIDLDTEWKCHCPGDE